MDKELLVQFTKLFAKYVVSICNQSNCDNCIFGVDDHYDCIFDGCPFQWEIV